MAREAKPLAELSGYYKSLDTCSACPKLCVHACPVGEATGNERFSPWGKMVLADQLRRGLRSLSAQEAEVFFHCLGCMLCTAVCEKEVLVDEVMDVGRIAAVRYGVAPERLNDWLETFKRFNNPYGENLHEKQRSLVDEVFWSASPQVVYFPGSTELALAEHHTKRTFAVFQALGIDFVGLFVGTDTSTGISLYRMGFEDLFKKHAYRVYRQLLGFKLIITGDPEVVYALRVIYPRYGFRVPARIQHISEFLLPYVQNHHGEALDDRSWCIHDNPMLARHIGVVEQPTKLLSLLMRRAPKELSWQGRLTWASGAELPVSFLYPDLAERIAKRRIEEMLEVGATLMITVSPADFAHFKKFVPSQLAVEGIIDIVYDHFVGG